MLRIACTFHGICIFSKGSKRLHHFTPLSHTFIHGINIGQAGDNCLLTVEVSAALARLTSTPLIEKGPTFVHFRYTFARTLEIGWYLAGIKGRQYVRTTIMCAVFLWCCNTLALLSLQYHMHTNTQRKGKKP